MSPDLKAFQSDLIHEAIDGSNLVRGPRGGARDLLLPREQETASQNAQVRDEGVCHGRFHYAETFFDLAYGLERVVESLLSREKA